MAHISWHAYECWFADFLRFYKRWPHEAVARRVMEVIKAFYKEFPNARTAPKAHMSQGGRMLSTSVEDGVEDEDKMPPI